MLKGIHATRDVVVKIVMLPESPGAALALKRARREVELLSAVDSPNVVKVCGEAMQVGQRPEALCWMEECLDGADVADLLDARWDDTAVDRLLRDIAAGLKACHDLRVVHRDLSASNVRRCEDGRFVLMDPGLARHLERTAVTGSFQPGTPGFRSPEHVPSGDPSPASDVFCLGILAFVARTGHFPVDPGDSDGDYYRRLVEEQVTPIREIDPAVQPELARVIDRCLQRQPARRYLDGTELLAALSAGGVP